VPHEQLRYVARQPILDARGRLHGYELLFRRSACANTFSGDGDAATRTVLDNTLIFGLEQLSGGMPVFVNCTQEALEKQLVMVLPPRQTVLELLETLEPTPALLEACRDLKARGFKLALDDFEWKPEWAPFVPLADYIKMDLSVTTASQRADLIQRVRTSNARLVAERVETQASLKMALAEGFLLFQGYYFCRPVLMQNRAVPPNRIVHLELLHALHAGPLDVSGITRLVKRDAALTYRLLLMVNSPLYGTGTEIRSIQQALVLIGDEMFRRVAMLAIASESPGKGGSELLRMAYLRGRFCELVAPGNGRDVTEQYLLGVLSLLPAMLGPPMETIVKTLPLRPPMREALLGKSNAERAVLEWLIAYESGDWEKCDATASAANLRTEGWSKRYIEALQWAEANLTLAID
jgi:EAL and modified HD-GYP domain-containing signal transduction protein